MASSESDHGDGNEKRKVSDLAAMFEKFKANAAPKSYPAVSRADSVTLKVHFSLIIIMVDLSLIITILVR